MAAQPGEGQDDGDGQEEGAHRVHGEQGDHQPLQGGQTSCLTVQYSGQLFNQEGLHVAQDEENCKIVCNDTVIQGSDIYRRGKSKTICKKLKKGDIQYISSHQ